MRLIVSGLHCERGGRILFSDLSFTLEAGNAVMLTGPNGAGKTSLLLILAGLLEAEAGEVGLEGEAGEEPSLPEDAHLVGHRDGVKSQLLVAENLAFWQSLLGGEGLSPREAASSAAVGSSRSQSGRRETRRRASATRRLCPAER